VIEAESSDEVWKARADFQREIFLVFDSRMTNFDNQVGVLIAAAVAILGFGGGAAANRGAPAWLLVAAAVAAASTTLLALYARQELPSLQLRPHYGQMMHKAMQAQTAVGAVYPDPQEQFTSAEEAYQAVFTAWWAQSESMQARKQLKQRIYVLAVLGLFVELVLVLTLLAL
jgi:hypothetical protein